MFPCKRIIICINLLSCYFNITKILHISVLLLVISCKPQFPSYISALLPQDQIFEPDPDFHFDSNPVKKKKEQQSEEIEEGNKLFIHHKEIFKCYMQFNTI